MIKNYLPLIAVVCTTAILYERGLKPIHEDYEKLTEQRKTIQKEYAAALKKKGELEQEIMSQSDPGWVSLTLIKVLGVVPEGSEKVYFKTE
jgi:hypothetical protein